MSDGPAFRLGWHAERAEFRSTDVNGRPVDPGAETDTQRTDRIRALQDRRMAEGGRSVPSAEPGAVVTEWMDLSPDNRMSAFAMAIAADPRKMPDVEMEPRPGQAPRPGGLLERMAAQRMARGSAG
jgi:hypothetical protein